MSKLKPLSCERFEAFIAYSRKPISVIFNHEVEYWSDIKERVIGLITVDKVDFDFSILIMGRDENKRFRPVWWKVDIETIEKARNELFNSLIEWSKKDDKAYYQNDIITPSIDIFMTITDLDDNNMNSSYKLLRDDKGFSAARGIIEEVMPHYIDIDGNQFVKQFQTTGFDQRLWELYLFCFFNENLCERDTNYNRPDFCLDRFNSYIGVEALTIGKPDSPSRVPSPDNSETFRAYMRGKFSNALRKKLNHKSPYWDEIHMQDKPFLLAVADFHYEAKIINKRNLPTPPSMAYSRPALEEYLYGGYFKMVKNSKSIISNQLIKFKSPQIAFFDLPNSENISAVIFSNLGTIAKFNRMGKVAGFGSNNVKILQVGEIYNPNPKATQPLLFSSQVKPNQHFEYWGDGINIYHNPNAKAPLDKDIFPNSLHHYLKNDTIVSEYNINSIHPYWSINFTTKFE